MITPRITNALVVAVAVLVTTVAGQRQPARAQGGGGEAPRFTVGVEARAPLTPSGAVEVGLHYSCAPPSETPAQPGRLLTAWVTQDVHGGHLKGSSVVRPSCDNQTHAVTLTVPVTEIDSPTEAHGFQRGSATGLGEVSACSGASCTTRVESLVAITIT